MTRRLQRITWEDRETVLSNSALLHTAAPGRAHAPKLCSRLRHARRKDGEACVNKEGFPLEVFLWRFSFAKKN